MVSFPRNGRTVGGGHGRCYQPELGAEEGRGDFLGNMTEFTGRLHQNNSQFGKGGYQEKEKYKT